MRNVIDKQIGSARDDSKVRSSTIRAEQPIAHSASIDLTVKLIVPINEYTYVRTKVPLSLSLSLALSPCRLIGKAASFMRASRDDYPGGMFLPKLFPQSA